MSTAGAIPTLLDDAPFSPSQRAWLHGFLSGLFQPTAAPQDAAAAPVDAPAEESFPWHDPALPMDERLALSEGRPKADRLMAAMAQLDCGSCGYDCRTYAQAIERGEEKDLTKCAPGGGETAAKLKQLIKLTVSAAPASASAAKAATVAAPVRPRPLPAPAAGASARYDRQNPYPARLVTATPLNKAGSAKDTRHVVVSLKGSRLTYAAGDALGVYPENRGECVQRIIELLQATGGEDVPGRERPTESISLHEALTRFYSITKPTPALLDLLAETAGPDHAADIRAMVQRDPGVHVLDLLERCATHRPDPARFVGTLASLRPRLYSIASSPRLHPEEVHLTVGVVRFTNAHGRACHGVASTCLADQLRPGERLRIFIQTAAHFRPPQDPATPAIMVGPGTGIAPFRAFLQDRQAISASGTGPMKNWLFFGDRHEAADFLYRDELERFRDQGVLHRLDTAFSRDGKEKVYVQHRMREYGAELWQWLEEGAHFYVCGDAQRMAADVDRALRDIVAEHGRLAPDAADHYVADLVKAKRYQRDVY